MAAKKQGPPLPPSPKASPTPHPAIPTALTEPPTPTLLLLPSFLDINGDSSPHCYLTKEFLLVPPTTFGDANTSVLGDSAMKSAEAGNFSDINEDSSPHYPLTQEYLPVSPTSFGDVDAAMFGSSAMKSAEPGAPPVLLQPRNTFLEKSVHPT